MIVWRDGELVAAENAVSATDRGWLIGDAVFETIFVDRCKPAFLKEHLARLSHGCEVLRIATFIDVLAIRGAIAALAAANGLNGRAACRITVSRVGGTRGLAPAPEAGAQVVVSLATIGDTKNTMNLAVSERRRWSGASTNTFKCGGAYAENLLARADAASAGADEAVMLNEHGRVACASAGNIFIVTGGGVLTPPLSEGAMPGVVRGVVLEEARKLRVPAVEMPVEAAALASTLLITNSIIGVARGAVDGQEREHSEKIVRRLADAYGGRLGKEIDGQFRSQS